MPFFYIYEENSKFNTYCIKEKIIRIKSLLFGIYFLEYIFRSIIVLPIYILMQEMKESHIIKDSNLKP